MIVYDRPLKLRRHNIGTPYRSHAREQNIASFDGVAPKRIGLGGRKEESLVQVQPSLGQTPNSEQRRTCLNEIAASQA